MKFGLSSYSLAGALADGRVSVPGLVEWAAQNGVDALELSEAGLGADLSQDAALRAELKAQAALHNVVLSNYVVGADFSGPALNGPDRDAEVARIKTHIDAAHDLGIERFRHDVFPWGWRPANYAQYRQGLESVVPACQEVADYAAQFGITTSVENHGMALNLSERILELVHLVDRDNFKVTLDIGNFLCLDESPEASVARLLPYATIVHLKDFYQRTKNPGDGWLKTEAGNYIQGSVLGLGDMDIARIFKIMHDGGYTGRFSLEYEGREDCLTAVPTGLKNANRLWEEVNA